MILDVGRIAREENVAGYFVALAILLGFILYLVFAHPAHAVPPLLAAGTVFDGLNVAPRAMPNSEQQWEFVNASEQVQIMGGAKRGGKSYAASIKAYLLSVLFPGNRGMIGRKDMTDLKDTALNTFFKVVPPEMILDHNKGDRLITVRSSDPDVPSTIVYRGLGDVADIEKSKGVDLGWLWVDEPSEVLKETYEMLESQLCWVLPDGERPPYMSMLTTNPEPGWVKDLKEKIERGEHPSGIFIPALPRFNPDLPPGWEAKMRGSRDVEWIAKYLDGSWAVGENSVFPELNPLIHDISDICATNPQFHVGMRKIGGIDYGTAAPTTYEQAAIDHEENLFFIAEHYESGTDKPVSHHCIGIKSIAARCGDQQQHGPAFLGNDYILIDPSTEAKTQQSGDQVFSIQDEFRRYGVPTIAGHRAKISIGINAIRELLRVDPDHPHPFARGPKGEIILGAPRMYICRHCCPMLWKEMEELRKEVRVSGTLEYIGADHAIDPVRYIVMSRPPSADRKKRDEIFLPTPQRLAARTHDSWSRKFGKKAGGENRWLTHVR